MNYRKLLSRHRSVLMGIAGLLILLEHSGWDGGVSALKLIARNGSIGVDIFVFVSGFGLAGSLNRRPEFYAYYRRRARRVLPAYYAVMLAMLAAGLALAVAGRRSDVGSWFLEHALPVGVWLNYVPKYWYVSATMGYYAIAPLFFFAIKRSRFPWASTAFLLAVTVLLVPAVSHMDNVAKVLGRLPALVLGLAVGTADQEECREGAPKWGTGLAALAFAALLSIAALYGLYRRGLAAYGGEMGSRLLLDLVAPPLCVLLAYLAEILERMPLRGVNRGLAHLGKYSLEIYLGHILIRDLLHRELHFRPVVVLLAMLALSYPAARAIHWTAERLLALWDRAMARLRRPDAA